MRGAAAAFGTGALFAVGLSVAGMTKPSKVVAFLDLAGAWDPSLAFVMLGAIAVHFVAYRLILRHRSAPLFDATFHIPTEKHLTGRLIAGAALFGVGWGLGGFCPGPGLVSAASGSAVAIVFVVGMTVGMILEHSVAGALARATDGKSPSRPDA